MFVTRSPRRSRWCAAKSMWVAWPARSGASWTLAPSRSTSSFTPSSARSKVARGPGCWEAVSLIGSMGSSPSAEAAGDVVLCQPIGRPREELLGRGHLDQVAGAVLAHRQEGGVVAGPRGLLHVVGDDDDRVVLLKLAHELLDLQRRDRVEGRARLVHEDDVRLDGDGASDA